MFAPLGERWSLATIRWWGAWAEGESVDTLIRYLLDELTRYEKNHWDALCPIPREAEQSFNGDHILTAPVTTAETRELKMSFDCQLDLSPSPSLSSSPLPSQDSSPALYQHAAIPHYSSGDHPIHPKSPANGNSASPSPDILQSLLLAASPSSLAPSPPVTQVALPKSCRSSATTGKPAPIPGVGIPDLPRGPDAWCTAIKQWEDPGASIGGKALKEWPEEWYT
ncbi:hypothetical protein K503DRAFT_803110, partial [Rhizopogon vinicolor AM-OR11-026]